jgi:hypothetical protein
MGSLDSPNREQVESKHQFGSKHHHGTPAMQNITMTDFANNDVCLLGS